MCTLICILIKICEYLWVCFFSGPWEYPYGMHDTVVGKRRHHYRHRCCLVEHQCFCCYWCHFEVCHCDAIFIDSFHSKWHLLFANQMNKRTDERKNKFICISISYDPLIAYRKPPSKYTTTTTFFPPIGDRFFYIRSHCFGLKYRYRSHSLFHL